MIRRLLALSVAFWLPAAAAASTIVALPEPELSRKADIIVFGTLIDTKTVINDRAQVLTHARLQVYQAVLGAKRGDVLLLQVPGGKLNNGMIAHTAGSPLLEPGDKVFGFLEDWGETVRPLGMAYGLLKVRGDAERGFFVYREVEGAGLISKTGKPAEPGVYTLKNEKLEDLVARIKGHLEATPLAPTTAPAPGTGVAR